MMVKFSTPLSEEAKKRLIEFIAAYIETLKVVEIDEKVDIAKQKAIEVLQTDIDIWSFGTIFLIIFNLVPTECDITTLNSKKFAEIVVEAFKQARALHKSMLLANSN